MSEDYTFKRLGHLGETHLVDAGSIYTLCEIRCDGPNFSERSPIPLEPRPDPTLCADCYDVLTARRKEEEEEKKPKPKKETKKETKKAPKEEEAKAEEEAPAAEEAVEEASEESSEES